MALALILDDAPRIQQRLTRALIANNSKEQVLSA